MAALVVKAALRAEPAVIGNRNELRATLIETAGLSSPEGELRCTRARQLLPMASNVGRIDNPSYLRDPSPFTRRPKPHKLAREKSDADVYPRSSMRARLHVGTLALTRPGGCRE